MVRVNGNNITFNKEQAGKVFGCLLQAYYQKEQLFSEGLGGSLSAKNKFPAGVLPGNIKSGSSEHALYLFFMNQLDSRVNSAILYSTGRMLFEENPILADPAAVTTTMGKLEFEQLISTYFGALIAERKSIFLLGNINRIVNDFWGDVLNLFDGVTDINEARRRVMSFPNYGEGLANLFLTYCLKYSLAEFDNPGELLPKIDFHDINICFSTKIISFEGKLHKDVITPRLQDFLSRHCTETRTKLFDLDEALWAIGSKLCSARNNSLCYDLCPASQYCTRNMPESYYKTGFIDSTTDVKSKQLALGLRTH